jgi:hypothetical protein
VFDEIGNISSHLWDTLESDAQTQGKFWSLALTGNFAEAAHAVSEGIKKTGSLHADEAAREAQIFKNLRNGLKTADEDLFPSPEEEERRKKRRLDALRTDKTTPPGGIADDSKARDAARDDLRHQAELDRIAKAEEALLVRQLQDEIAIWKAYEKQRETVEKNSFEDGKLTTDEYYRRRQVDLKTETEKELQILREALKATEDEITRAAAQRDSNTAKAGQFRGRAQREGATTTGGKEATSIARDYEGEASKNEASRLAALEKFNELQTKINTTTIDAQTKSIVLEGEKNKEIDADRKKAFEFEAELAALQGKRIEQSKAQIEAEAEEKKQALLKVPDGRSPDQINAEIERFKQLKLAAGEFAQIEDDIQKKEKQFQVDSNSFEIARKTIEAEQKAGLLSKAEAEKQINKLIEDRLPALKKEAQAELEIAQAALRQAQTRSPQTQNLDQVTQLQEQVTAAQNLINKLNELGIKTDQVGKRISEELGGEFGKFFNDISFGAETVGRAFAQMEVAVLSSLERIAAQMLVNALTQRAIGEGTKLGDAEVAAANVYAQVSAIPVVGWVLAPVAAAAAFAAVLAFEQGGIIPGSSGQAVPIIGHGGEAVLPEHISTGLDYAIRTGSFNPPEALSQPIAARGGNTYNAGDTYHLHHNGEDAKSVLERELVPMIQTARRRNQLGI